MKTFYQLDGTQYDVPEGTCRGCWMEKNSELLPELAKPILENKDVIVRQDVEFPVPGFFIVSVKEHVGSIADLSTDVQRQFFLALYHLRKCMKDNLGIRRAQIYHEEKLTTPHLHFWVLPLWPEKLVGELRNPRIYDGTIMPYLKSFSIEETEEKISKLNSQLAALLGQNQELNEEGFVSKWIS